MNTFGRYLRLTTFGESHGPAMGGILDGMPSRIPVSEVLIQKELDRRRPGSGMGASRRSEPDKIRILSGISTEGLTLGSPIGFIIPNRDARPADYSDICGAFRPNHADFTWQKKYGIREIAGGGRASARETVNWVAGGAIARQLLSPEGISVEGWISGVGEWQPEDIYVKPSDFKAGEAEIERAMRENDSVGARISCIVRGCPIGLGEPVFGKLHSRLAEAMMTINAAKSFEYGLGRDACRSRGSEVADIFVPDNMAPEGVSTLTNYSGGIQGGVSNGMDICFAVGLKPTPTLMMPVDSVDVEGKPCTIHPRGRHDVCVALRAVPVVEAMACLVLADMLLASRMPLKARKP